jgi:hypothetical protein
MRLTVEYSDENYTYSHAVHPLVTPSAGDSTMSATFSSSSASGSSSLTTRWTTGKNVSSPLRVREMAELIAAAIRPAFPYGYLYDTKVSVSLMSRGTQCDEEVLQSKFECARRT